ncbi:MAG: S8 family serine peptidase [Bdellovibrionaceae bacterium]|nr:S8 family serine peptidase [Pseudobdellovibrionaceae bacterium]
MKSFLPYQIWYGLMVIIPLILFNNCGKGFRRDNSFVLSETFELPSLYYDDGNWPEVQCPTTQEKIRIAVTQGQLDAEENKIVNFDDHNQNNKIIAHNLRRRWIANSENLAVTIHNQCFLEGKSTSFLALPVANLTPEATYTTFRLPVNEAIWGEELYREAINDPCVVSVSLDEDIPVSQVAGPPPNDPRYPEQNYLRRINHAFVYSYAYNQFNGIKIDVPVAVVDTGVDINHPDLNSMILRDQNGNLVTLNGMNSSNNPNDVTDSGFHGTHVSGIIAAQGNNGIGISGVGGRGIKLIPIKASNDGNTLSLSAILNGIRWAVDRGARVINLSLGGSVRNEDFLNAIRYAESKGVLVIAAAGNEGRELNSNYTIYPAMFTTEVSNMLTVGSLDASSGNRSNFSNYSSTYVDLFAPGSDGSSGILSTVPVRDGSYASRLGGQPINGTSMAAPVVSAAAALVIGLAESRGFPISHNQVKLFFEKAALRPFRGLEKVDKVLDLWRLLETVALDSNLSLLSQLPPSEMRGRLAFEQQSSSIGLPAGRDVEISVKKSADSSILAKYQWFKNGQPIAGGTGPTLKLKNLSLEDKGIYVNRTYHGKTIIQSSYIKINVAKCP